MTFRYDINGLRAIAVIAVVLFHYEPDLLPGGFAGVDVFFVISGFLMTGIIFRGVEQNSFSVLRFYIARANRIIPALAVVCLAITVWGYFFLTPWDYKTVGRDIATSMFFVSNIMFSFRRGYFDSEDNFLLHTWSLSAEWQFYILFPAILVLMRRFMSVKAMKACVLVGTAAGYVFCVAATYKWTASSYFLLPMRAWEMMAGGVAFLYPINLQSKVKHLVEKTGIVLILASYIFISKDNYWPGYLAVIPVLGAFLVIQAQNDSIFTNNIVFQKLGSWSYSIYLWHWPILLLFSYYFIDEKYEILGALLSVLIAYLSYRFVESRRIRRVDESVLKPLLKYSLILIVFGFFGTAIFKTKGFAQREDLTANSLIRGGTMDDYQEHEGVSLLNSEIEYDYVLIGDSNADHYVRGILHKGTKVKLSWYSDCLSFPHSISTRQGVYVSWKENCRNNFRIGLNESKPIIIAQRWRRAGKGSLECVDEGCNLIGEYDADLRTQLNDLFRAYSDSKSVYLVGELPKPVDNQIMKCLKTSKYFGVDLDCKVTDKLQDDIRAMNRALRAVASEFSNVTFIDPTKYICSNGRCKYSFNGNSIFMTDGTHLSGYGAEVIWSDIIDEIKQYN
ncbi:acyltransferase [Vibrio sp. JC009]|uniref:acyltransferase family protein n=1 Tax=Vibrio sp. JC009 TaxID=2912314 RepID=UPI0023B10E69|nr:acyltransferase family protein [Vibrio sp. JC009]WED20613.1 acyltransferase [Vibrio sp. JC009]